MSNKLSIPTKSHRRGSCAQDLTFCVANLFFMKLTTSSSLHKSKKVILRALATTQFLDFFLKWLILFPHMVLWVGNPILSKMFGFLVFFWNIVICPNVSHELIIFNLPRFV